MESSGHPPGAVFRLMSSELSRLGGGVTGPYLLTFWYHMYGSTVGSLAVHEVYAGGVYGKRVWMDPGGQRTGKGHFLLRYVNYH